MEKHRFADEEPMGTNPFRELLSPITCLKGVGSVISREFGKRGVHTVCDLLYFLPRSYQDRRRFVPLHELRSGQIALIKGRVQQIKRLTVRYRRVIEMLIGNGRDSVAARWIGAPQYLFRFKRGENIVLFGRFRAAAGILCTYHPEIIEEGDRHEMGGLVSLYPEIEGISQRRVRRIVRDTVNQFTQNGGTGW